MDCDQALEDDSPCRVAKPVLQRPEDLPDACLARVCRNQDMLDIFRLGGCGLKQWRQPRCAQGVKRRRGAERRRQRTLTLVAPFTDFSNELAMVTELSASWATRRDSSSEKLGLGTQKP